MSPRMVERLHPAVVQELANSSILRAVRPGQFDLQAVEGDWGACERFKVFRPGILLAFTQARKRSIYSLVTAQVMTEAFH